MKKGLEIFSVTSKEDKNIEKKKDFERFGLSHSLKYNKYYFRYIELRLVECDVDNAKIHDFVAKY